MGVLRDTILVSVATLGVGSAFMEIDSKNTTFNKVFPYIGTFLSAGIGYYFLRQAKLIKAGEYQPDQEITDYSLNDLATSSAIEGFEPFKYSVVGNRAEGLETKKEEPPEFEDPLESWMEEYDAESVLKEKPSMNFTWKKFSDWEIEPTMQKIKDMTKNEMIVPYPFGIEKRGSLKDQAIEETDEFLIYPNKQNLKEYMNLVSLSGYFKYGDATFYLLQTNMRVLKDKVKRGDSIFKDENSYLVYCEHDGKMNLVCGASYPIKDDKVYRLLRQTVPTIRQGFTIGRRDATQYAENYLYFHVLKPELEYSFEESFEMEFGERKQEDYQNMIIPLKYKRKIKGKAIPFTNYYYTNHRGELDFLFAIGKFDRPLNEKMTFYCDMGWQFGTFNTPDTNYPMPKLSWSKNYGAERLAKIFAERPIIQMWVKSVTLDSDNLKTRRINMFNEDKQAWFDQQFKPMLIANFNPLIFTGWNYPSQNVYEEFMRMTMKRLEADNKYPVKKDLGFSIDSNPLPYFKQDISYYDWLNSVYRSTSRDKPLFYQRPPSPLTPYFNRFVSRRTNPYGLSESKTYYTIQGKMTANLDKVKENLNLLSIPQPNVGWYKRLRTENDLMKDNSFGRIASGVLTIGVYFNNSVYHQPLSVIPFEISNTKNQYVKAFRLLYSRALRENQIGDPQTIFEDRLKYSLYSIDEDAIRELDRSNEEAKKVVEDYYKQLDDMILEKLNGYGFKHHSVRKAETFEAEGDKKPYSVEISRSSNPEKKLMAIFSDKEGNKVKTTHFGQRGASDYTKHGDKERMQRYLERHGGGTTTSTKEDWKDPTTAGSLSRWVLWNKPSLSGSFADYKRRFGLKGSLNVSKSAEGLETKNTENYCSQHKPYQRCLSCHEDSSYNPLSGCECTSKEIEEKVGKIPYRYGTEPYEIKFISDEKGWEIYCNDCENNWNVPYTPKGFGKQSKDPQDFYPLSEMFYQITNEEPAWLQSETFDYCEFCPNDVKVLSEDDGYSCVGCGTLTCHGCGSGDEEKHPYCPNCLDAESFEATEWVGFCPECNKWRTKDMSHLFKNNTSKSDDEYIIDLSWNGWSVPKKLLNKRVCGKYKRYGKIQRTQDSWTGYGQRTHNDYICGTPLTKVKSKYKAEFEAEIKPYMKELPFPDNINPTKELGFLDKNGNPFALYIGSDGHNTYEDYGRLEWWVVGEGEGYEELQPHQESEVKRFLNEYLKYHGVPEYEIIWRNDDYDPDFPSSVFITLNPLPADEEKLWKSYWDNKKEKSCSHENLSIKIMEVLNGELLLTLDCDNCGKRTSTSASLNQGWDAEFEAKTPAQKSLDKWTKEDWGTKSGKPSTQGEEATGERYLPAKAREALTDKEYARTTAKKRRDTKAGKQFSPQPDDIEEKVKKYRSETFEAIEGKGSNARFTDQPDPKVYRDPALRQKARNKLLKGNKGGDEGEWSARKAQMSATEYRKLYENKYGEGKNPYF